MALMPVDQALARLLSSAEPDAANPESVPLKDAAGRVLARDLAAKRTQPPFPASAMDGYAVRHEDIADIPAELKLIGTSAAGHGFDGTLKAGETVRIFTGAPVPEGADTVVIQENTETSGENRVRVVEPTAKGRHIRAAGLDFAKGDALLKAGEDMDAGRLMLAAAMNHAEVPVYRKPRVAILATGDELVAPGTEPGPDQIIASNTFGISALAAQAGAHVIDLGIAGDTAEAIEAALDRAEAGKADILVTIGGASVGDHDLVQPVMKKRGMALDFWKIAMRPGKPLMFGRLGALRIVGLPGNPVSSLVCAHLFLVPLIAKLAGKSLTALRGTARLTTALPANDERQDHVRARLAVASDGTLEAAPFDRQDSSMMAQFSEAGCLIVRPPHAPSVDAGYTVPVFVLRAPSS